MNDIITNIEENDPHYSTVMEGYEHLSMYDEKIADLNSQLQRLRMKYIEMTEKAGHLRVRGGGVEVLKVKKIGVQEGEN